MQIELYTYASLVETDLGRGNHSYLALVLLDAEYLTIPYTELFIPPIYLLLLIVPNNATPI